MDTVETLPAVARPRRQSEPLEEDKRFEFGDNWRRFLNVLSEQRIDDAARSIRDFLGLDSLRNKTFLDVGSGSGLFSLAAWRLGAVRIHSFDYDPQSVACTRELRRRYSPENPNWTVEPGDALNADYLSRLGTFDVVYSWGVLHHTGAMWNALDNVAPLVNSGGLLYIAIYNDQGNRSRRWRSVKRTYNQLPRRLQFPFAAAIGAMLHGRRWLARFVNSLWRPAPADATTANSRVERRGMSDWYDLVDWVGGYPFEVAKPEEIFHFFRKRSFVLENLSTAGGGLACNQYVLRKPAA